MGSITIRPSKGMFNDEEVGTEAHDRIVNWLSLPDNLQQVADLVFGLPHIIRPEPAPLIEHAITSGRNKFLLGFADVVAPGLLIEVKTGAIRTGELLRQVNAYKSAMHFNYTWLVTPQELDDTTVAVLAQQGVTYVHFKWGDDGEPLISAPNAAAAFRAERLEEMASRAYVHMREYFEYMRVDREESALIAAGLRVRYGLNRYVLDWPPLLERASQALRNRSESLEEYLRGWFDIPDSIEIDVAEKRDLEELPPGFWDDLDGRG